MQYAQFLFSRSLFLTKDRKGQEYAALKGEGNLGGKQSSKKI